MEKKNVYEVRQRDPVPFALDALYYQSCDFLAYLRSSCYFLKIASRWRDRRSSRSHTQEVSPKGVFSEVRQRDPVPFALDALYYQSCDFLAYLRSSCYFLKIASRWRDRCSSRSHTQEVSPKGVFSEVRPSDPAPFAFDELSIARVASSLRT